MTTDYAAAISVLLAEQVQFLVVGGYAAGFHGSAILTFDLDICYQRTKENMERLARAMSKLQPKLRGAENVPFLLDAKTFYQGMNFTFSTSVGDIDLLGTLSGAGGYDDLIQDSIEVKVGPLVFRVASLAAIIKSKKAAGRGKDLLALPELESLLGIQPKDETK
jgi:hypothetical protein